MHEEPCTKIRKTVISDCMAQQAQMLSSDIAAKVNHFDDPDAECGDVDMQSDVSLGSSTPNDGHGEDLASGEATIEGEAEELSTKRRLTKKSKPENLYRRVRMKVSLAKSAADAHWSNHLAKIAAVPKIDGNLKAIEGDSRKEDVVLHGRFREIHASHRKRSIRNLVFCMRCGVRMAQRCGGLKAACRGKPTASNVAKLKRIIEGYHPEPPSYRSTWEDGVSTKHRFPVVAWG